jgi:hypothetical protein
VKEIAARLLRSLVSLVLAGSAMSCAPLETVPPAPPIPARSTGIDAHALALAAIDCVMAPVVYDTPAWASNDAEVASLGADGASCEAAAGAARVGSARLYRVDSDALLDVRQAIRLGGATERDPRDMVALFDESLAAVMEARRARTALDRDGARPSSESIAKIRSRAMLAKLEDFGTKRGGPTGAEARAVARLVAANEFLQVARVEPPLRRYAAEPLLALMSSAAGEHAPSTLHGAVGGGPRDDLRAVSDAAANDMRSLVNEIPAGRLRAALERTALRLAKFDPDSVASGL